MKKILLLATATAFALASCSKSDVSTDISANGSPINFSPYSSNATKGTIIDNTNITSFGVYGFAHDDGTVDFTTAIPGFMYNQEVTKAGAVWTYSPVKYWSNDASDMYSFFGYAPYADGTIIKVKSLNNTAGAPVLTYTMPTDPTTALDFVAGQTLDIAKQTGAVTVNLKHQLSRLTFEAKSSIEGAASFGSDSTNIIVKSISIAGGGTVKVSSSADYTFSTDASTNATASDHDQNGTWSNFAGDLTLNFSDLLDKDNPEYGSGTVYPASVGKVILNNQAAGTYTSLFGDDNHQFVIPPNGEAGLATGSNVSFTIDYDILTKDPAVANGYTFSSNRVVITLPDGGLAQGKAYNYQITFTLTEVKLSANVVDWDTGTATSGTTTESTGIPTTLPTAP